MGVIHNESPKSWKHVEETSHALPPLKRERASLARNKQIAVFLFRKVGETILVADDYAYGAAQFRE